MSSNTTLSDGRINAHVKLSYSPELTAKIFVYYRENYVPFTEAPTNEGSDQEWARKSWRILRRVSWHPSEASACDVVCDEVTRLLEKVIKRDLQVAGYDTSELFSAVMFFERMASEDLLCKALKDELEQGFFANFCFEHRVKEEPRVIVGGPPVDSPAMLRDNVHDGLQL
jgi:hypothetical protein